MWAELFRLLSCFSNVYCWAGASDEPSFGLSFFPKMLLESRGQEKQSFPETCSRSSLSEEGLRESAWRVSSVFGDRFACRQAAYWACVVNLGQLEVLQSVLCACDFLWSVGSKFQVGAKH